MKFTYMPSSLPEKANICRLVVTMKMTKNDVQISCQGILNRTQGALSCSEVCTILSSTSLGLLLKVFSL